MVILENLYDIYGILIAKKGERVTQRLIDRIKNMPKVNVKKTPLRDTFIYNDVKKILHDRKYKVIFHDRHIKKDRILKIAGNTVFEDGIIKELAFMKTNRPYTYHHELIVGVLTIKMTLALKKYRLNSRTASYGAFTHDIGKNRIPREVLSKSTVLTVKEYELIRTHPTIGYLLLIRYERKKDSYSANTAYQHHERLDGTGYPMSKKKINIYAQLVAANDILDALLAKRPYRKETFKLRVALDYMLEEVKDKKLNKDAVLALVSFARKDKPDFNMLKVSLRKRGSEPKGSVYGKLVHAVNHW